MSEHDIARAAARRLSTTWPDGFPEMVEARIAKPDPGRDTYLDPVTVSLAAVLVSAASLAWTIYKDLKAANKPPNKETLVRTIRVELVVPENVPEADRDLIITAVAEETLKLPNS